MSAMSGLGGGFLFGLYNACTQLLARALAVNIKLV